MKALLAKTMAAFFKNHDKAIFRAGAYKVIEELVRHVGPAASGWMEISETLARIGELLDTGCGTEEATSEQRDVTMFRKALSNTQSIVKAKPKFARCQRMINEFGPARRGPLPTPLGVGPQVPRKCNGRNGGLDEDRHNPAREARV